MNHLFTLLLCLWLSNFLLAQPGFDYYWVGTASNGVQGSGTWTDLNAWRIGSVTGTVPTQVPISNNNVFFTAAAFPTTLAGATPVEITVDATANCQNFIWDNNLPVLVQKIIFQTTTPMTTFSPLFLEVLGNVNLPLPNQVQFNFNGILRLGSGAPLVTLQSNGQKLLVRQLDFAANSDTTEFRLLDPLYVDDPRENHYSRAGDGGVCKLQRGYLNFNGQDAVLDRFDCDDSNLAGRRLNIANSNIQLIGHADRVWSINFNAAGTNYTGFDATGSHLVVREPTGLGYGQQLYLGDMTYDSITIDARYTNTIRYYAPRIGHLFLNNDVNFTNGIQLTVDNLYLKGGFIYSLNNSNDGSCRLIIGNVTNTATCDRFALLKGGSGKGYVETITSNTNLVFDRFILHDIEGDISNGSTYTANNSVDGNGNVNWTINSNTGREMRFRYSNGGASTNHYWHTLTNWEEFDGSNWIAASCLPTPLDNVHFDAASFPPTGNQRLRVDSTANCNDMRWASSVDNRIEFYTYLYTRLTTRILNIFGTIELSPDMRVGCVGRSWVLWGTTNDSIITNNVYIGNSVYLRRYSEYEVAGNYQGRALYATAGSFLKSNDNRLDLGLFGVDRRQMNNVEVNLTHDRAYAFRDYGSFDLATSYTGNTTFHFWGDRRFYNCNGNATGDGRVYLYGQTGTNAAHLPNTIIHGDLYGIIYNITVHGDFLLKGNGRFTHSTITSNVFKRILVLGDQPSGSYNGDMTLTAGKNYIFDSYYANYYNPTSIYFGRNSRVEVQGTLTALGTCEEPISIRTKAGQPMTWDLNLVNIENTYLEGVDNINAPFNVVNSVDGGGNSNINFLTSGTGNTLYWRAHYSDASDFEGIWQDPGHWTTNPASLIGDSSCIPSTLDTVIFDNRSFSATSNDIVIDELAFCKTMWVRADVALRSTSLGAPSGTLIINESLLIDLPLTQNRYTGVISFVGNGGTIRTSGTTLVNSLIELRQTGAVWELDDEFRLNHLTNTRHGILSLVTGTLRTNNHTLHLHNGFESVGQDTRVLDLGTSTVNLYTEGRYRSNNAAFPWYIPNGQRNITVLGENSTFNFYDNNGGTGNIQVYLGYDSLAYQITRNSIAYQQNNIRYGVINFNAVNEVTTIRGYARATFMNFSGDAVVVESNVVDSISFAGGHLYRFNQNTAQHLVAPHGKIISRGSGSDFVNIETNPVGGTSYFHKEWGDYFCLDYIKVKDNTATKGINPNTGIADADLFFYTGTNSDNVGGTAKGIWNYSLLFSTHGIQAPVATPCDGQDSAAITIFITGNDFYDIRYQWMDSLGNSGADTVQVNDDDNDPTTPFAFTIRGAVLASGYYAFDVATFRCDKRTAATLDTVWVYKTTPNTLVDQDRTASCYLTNTTDWVDFYDEVEAKPVLSLQDQTTPSDSDSLKNVMAEVYLESTVLYYAGRPYLPRHWKITPENNVGAKVRLYFTAQELDQLYQRTHHGRAGLPFGAGPAYVEVWKFDAVPHQNAFIGSSAPSVVPHTVLPVTGAAAKAFTNTTDVLGIEFEVGSFSHFIIVPTEPVLLSTNLLRFEAAPVGKLQTALTWELSTTAELDYFEVLRSQDGINFEPFTEAAVTSALVYNLEDNQANVGYNYYRLRLHHEDGTATLSDMQVVYFEGTQLLDVFPNPVGQGALTIRLSSLTEMPLRLQWVNPLGQLIQEQTQAIARGTNTFTVTTEQLAAGIYMLQIYQGNTLVGQRKISKTE